MSVAHDEWMSVEWVDQSWEMKYSDCLMTPDSAGRLFTGSRSHISKYFCEAKHSLREMGMEKMCISFKKLFGQRTKGVKAGLGLIFWKTVEEKSITKCDVIDKRLFMMPWCSILWVCGEPKECPPHSQTCTTADIRPRGLKWIMLCDHS